MPYRTIANLHSNGLTRGIYETTYGNAAYVSSRQAKTAYDLDMGERIPIDLVTTKLIRKAERGDAPQRRGWK